MISTQESIRLIFGLKIKTLRQQKGMNYHQLADATGMAVSYLHDIECGKKYPKADKIIALAKALNVDYDYLVSLSATKRLQPIIDLLNSDFMNVVPWEHFGLSPSSLLDLFSNTTDKVTAFISTMLKLSRSVQMSKENFYTSALRSFQDIHDNYFEKIESSVKDFIQESGLTENKPVTVIALEAILLEHYSITVDRKSIATKEALKRIRSYYSEQQKVLYLNKGYTDAQEKFLLGRELAFQYLQLDPRPYETILMKASSFDMLLNNFKSSYFASALLMQEDVFTEDIKRITAQKSWDASLWTNLLDTYDVTAEMLFQRITNILPGHFATDKLFFLRMTGNVETGEYEMTKELHLSQLHNPYGNSLHEHYCRRWVAIQTINEVMDKMKKKKYRDPIIHAQVSEYWQTHNRYFCISIAKPVSKKSNLISCVTIGLLIDPNLTQKMPFINDHKVITRTVHTTCERCGIVDCKERAIAPSIIEAEHQLQLTQDTLKEL